MLSMENMSTPCYVVDEAQLIRNLEVLKGVSDRTGCTILLAQKAFSMYSLYPLIGRYLAGSTASSLYEARLGYEEMGGETHVFSAAYDPAEFSQLVAICDHIVFNSFAQWQRFKPLVKQSGRPISCGIRVNPEYSETETALYDPCAPGSRLGVTLHQFQPELMEGLEGIHFHTMCEQNSDVLARTLEQVELKFGAYFSKLKWINFGGGHHITRKDYDIKTLERCILHFQKKHNLHVYLEPGEAVALNAGLLGARVLDFVENNGTIAILDTSAACHMPDVLEMPYTPSIAGTSPEYTHTYRLAGPTCLAGDIIGTYSFNKPLEIGDLLLFQDMAIYTMVKNNTFNGIRLPSIALLKNGELQLVREFGYADFKGRL